MNTLEVKQKRTWLVHKKRVAEEVTLSLLSSLVHRAAPSCSASRLCAVYKHALYFILSAMTVSCTNFDVLCHWSCSKFYLHVAFNVKFDQIQLGTIRFS